MQRDGMLLHLFTFEKAWKQCGGEERILLEVDLKRGPQHDLSPDDGLYSSLITAPIQGKILGIIGGPNCGPRSVLHHYEIPGCDSAPRPVRARKGEEYGKKDWSEKEREVAQSDDNLLWRQVFLYMIATYARRALGHGHPLASVLEQPSSPRSYKPEVVSFWDQWEWQEIKSEFSLKETHFTQTSLGGEATKPTTLGTSLDLVPEDFQIKGPIHPGGVRSSKDLARWPWLSKSKPCNQGLELPPCPGKITSGLFTFHIEKSRRLQDLPRNSSTTRASSTSSASPNWHVVSGCCWPLHASL